MSSPFFKPVEEIDLEELGVVISEGRYPRPIQDGPVRWFDTGTRCVSKGCGSFTHCKLSNVPYCMKHIITKLNERLIELGVAA